MSISMAMAKPRTHQRKTKISLFLSCFGCSKKVSLDKPLETQLSNTHIKKRWLLWSRFRMKPSGTKTAPLVKQSSEKATSHRKYKKSRKSKSKSKSKSKPDKSIFIQRQTPTTTSPQLNRFPGLQDLPPSQKDIHGDHHLRNAETLDEAALIDDTCPPKRLPSDRTNNTVKTALSHTNSSSNRSSRVSLLLLPTASVMISNAVSSPVPGRYTGNQSPHNGLAKLTKLKDPVIVLTIIIMVSLIMVILCGRLCAILCTSVWFYFVPRLRITETVVANEEANSSVLNHCSDHLDLDSKDYRKKVILEGLLERNHRN